MWLVMGWAQLAIAGGLTVDVDGDCPGTLDFEVRGLTTGTTMVLLGGLDTGGDTVGMGPCAGTVTGLVGLRVVAKVQDEDGDGRVGARPTLSGPACEVPLQVMDTSTCELSRVFNMSDDMVIIPDEASSECADNPLWTPVTCTMSSWLWSSDRAHTTVEDAEMFLELYSGCTHSSDNPDGMCSLTGDGWVSTESWTMSGCDSSWYHLGGSYTGNCGGHDGDTVRRYVTSDEGCYDYRDLEPF